MILQNVQQICSYLYYVNSLLGCSNRSEEWRWHVAWTAFPGKVSKQACSNGFCYFVKLVHLFLVTMCSLWKPNYYWLAYYAFLCFGYFEGGDKILNINILRWFCCWFLVLATVFFLKPISNRLYKLGFLQCLGDESAIYVELVYLKSYLCRLRSKKKKKKAVFYLFVEQKGSWSIFPKLPVVNAQSPGSSSLKRYRNSLATPPATQDN